MIYFIVEWTGLDEVSKVLFTTPERWIAEEVALFGDKGHRWEDCLVIDLHGEIAIPEGSYEELEHLRKIHESRPLNGDYGEEYERRKNKPLR